MPALPVLITEPEMIRVLSSGKRRPEFARLASGQLVATWTVGDTGMLVKVYTSVFGAGAPGDAQGLSRGVGEDSIRICLVDASDPHERRGVGKSTHTTRTVGWEDRLIKKVVELFTLAKRLPTCPLCGARMAARKGVYGQFYGCTEYPACKGTRKCE